MVAGRVTSEAVFWGFIGVEPVPGLREEMRRNHSMEVLAEGYRACMAVTRERVAEISGVRVAIVAGGRRDDIEGTREVGRVLERGGSECRAFVVKEAVHLWDLQLPELFARGARAWVEGREMPEEFEVLK